MILTDLSFFFSWIRGGGKSRWETVVSTKRLVFEVGERLEDEPALERTIQEGADTRRNSKGRFSHVDTRCNSIYRCDRRTNYFKPTQETIEKPVWSVNVIFRFMAATMHDTVVKQLDTQWYILTPTQCIFTPSFYSVCGITLDDKHIYGYNIRVKVPRCHKRQCSEKIALNLFILF